MSFGPIDLVGLFVFAAVMSVSVWTGASWRRSSLIGCMTLAAHYAFWYSFGVHSAHTTGDQTGPVLLGVVLLLLEVPACAILVGFAAFVIKLKKRGPLAGPGA